MSDHDNEEDELPPDHPLTQWINGLPQYSGLRPNYICQGNSHRWMFSFRGEMAMTRAKNFQVAVSGSDLRISLLNLFELKDPATVHPSVVLTVMLFGPKNTEKCFPYPVSDEPDEHPELDLMLVSGQSEDWHPSGGFQESAEERIARLHDSVFKKPSKMAGVESRPSY